MKARDEFNVVRNDSAEAPADCVRVAVVQMDPRIGEWKSNLDRSISALRTAREAGAKLVGFTECALTGYCFSDSEEAKRAAIEKSDLDPLIAATGEMGMAAVIGYLERTPEGLFNSVSLVSGEGILGHYQKTHLPHLGGDRFAVPGKNGFEVHEVFGLRVGLLICYDASFPETCRLLALSGVDMIFLPTNWAEEAEQKSHWLPNTRAYENVIYVASINRVGEERGYVFHGMSKICDPNGETLLQAPRDRETILVADIDPRRSRTKKIMRRPDWWVDRIGQRRQDLYELSPRPRETKDPS